MKQFLCTSIDVMQPFTSSASHNKVIYHNNKAILKSTSTDDKRAYKIT